jgi:hypothetical protein
MNTRMIEKAEAFSTPKPSAPPLEETDFGGGSSNKKPIRCRGRSNRTNKYCKKYIKYKNNRRKRTHRP